MESITIKSIKLSIAEMSSIEDYRWLVKKWGFLIRCDESMGLFFAHRINELRKEGRPWIELMDKYGLENEIDFFDELTKKDRKQFKLKSVGDSEKEKELSSEIFRSSREIRIFLDSYAGKGAARWRFYFSSFMQCQGITNTSSQIRISKKEVRMVLKAILKEFKKWRSNEN